MLEKTLKKAYFDAHFHWFFAKNNPENHIDDNFIICGCTCAHSIKEWKFQEEKRAELKLENEVFLSFGIHPQCCNQNTDLDELCVFMEKLASDKKLDAIGEMGFDFYTSEYKSNAVLQEKMFVFQLELALKYNLPVVIHCRKANEKLFEYSKSLKKLPFVLFHSFMGTAVEANSLINRGINAKFSFGKQMMNNNKKVIECVRELPLERLLFETDAPYQTLKNEKETYLVDIRTVYDAAWKIRQIDLPDLSFEEFYNQLSLPTRPAGKNR